MQRWGLLTSCCGNIPVLRDLTIWSQSPTWRWWWSQLDLGPTGGEISSVSGDGAWRGPHRQEAVRRPVVVIRAKYTHYSHFHIWHCLISLHCLLSRDEGPDSSVDSQLTVSKSVCILILMFWVLQSALSIEAKRLRLTLVWKYSSRGSKWQVLKVPNEMVRG